MVFQFKSVTVSLLVLGLMLGTSAVSQAAQADSTPPKELLQYIREAKRAGVAEAKIKGQAIAVGWSASAVDEALAFAKTGKLPARVAPSEVAAAPAISTPSPAQSAETAAPAAADPGKPPAPPPVGAPVVRSDDYLIGSGDTLQISVWSQPEASVPSALVRPDGKITMPLIKEVAVTGLTPPQAEAVIAEAFSKFFVTPNVTVVVAANNKKIYLIGAVRKEGTLAYTYGMTVLQALSEAGGLTDYAKRKNIYVLRTENGREYRLDFNYEEVVKGQRMIQNAVLLPGDTVVIPQ